MASTEQAAVPTQHRVWPDEQAQSAQGLAAQRRQQRGEERPVHSSEPHPPVAELAFQDGDLVAQGENLGVLVVLVHR
jgi:hypothetical protein